MPAGALRRACPQAHDAPPLCKGTRKSHAAPSRTRKRSAKLIHVTRLYGKRSKQLPEPSGSCFFGSISMLDEESSGDDDEQDE
ncbi:hypothetical protein VE23_01930 [Paenibacillus sp. D9]|nr:hypothetical protein VE23_01930 [Paenibacillus sp. D9]